MSKPLNNLYGRGASAAFVRAMPDSPKVREVEVPGGVRLYVKWPRSEMKLDCAERSVHFLWLRSGRKGLYGEICDAVESYFRERGVRLLTATGDDAQAEEILLRRGGWQKVGGRLEWEL